MARLARVVIPGAPHHVVQRGNRRMKTFFGDEDYAEYLSLLSTWCGRHGVAIWAYCLMPNHVHLILVPPDEGSLCRAVGEVHRRYTRRVNFREGWRGHLWQGRFSSFVMDDVYLASAARYVERNPVKARLVAEADNWPWSIAAEHVDRRRKGVAESDWLAEVTAGWVCSWRQYLADADETDLSKAMLRHERTGRPMGDSKFVSRLEAVLGRTIARRKPGPKPTRKPRHATSKGEQ